MTAAYRFAVIGGLAGRQIVAADGAQVEHATGDLVLWVKTGRRARPTKEVARFPGVAWVSYERVTSGEGGA